MSVQKRDRSSHIHMEDKKGFFTESEGLIEAHRFLENGSVEVEGEEKDPREAIFNEYLESNEWEDNFIWVDPDYDPEEGFDWNAMETLFEQHDVIESDSMNIIRGDQVATPNVYQEVMNALAETVERNLDNEVRFNHVGATKEPFSPSNAKHRLGYYPFGFDKEGVKTFSVAQNVQSGDPVRDADINEFIAGQLAGFAGFERGSKYDENESTGDIADALMSRKKSESARNNPADLMHRGANATGINAEGDVTDIYNRMMEPLIDSGLQPRTVKAPVGPGTVGDEELDEDRRAMVTLAWDEDGEVYKPAKPTSEGMKTKETWSGMEIERTVEEVKEEGVLTAAQSYGTLVPALSLSGIYIQPRGVNTNNEYSALFKMEETLEDMDQVPFDTVPIMSPGSITATSEGEPAVSEEYADLIDSTKAADKQDWNLDEGPIDYQEEALLTGAVLKPDQREHIREELVDQTYEDLGMDPENPGSVNYPEFAQQFVENVSEYLTEYTEVE